MPRQQRSPNWRGKVQAPNRYQANQLPARITGVTSNGLTLEVPVGSGVLIKTAIPQFYREAGTHYPTICTVAGNEVVLTWPDNVSDPSDFILQQFDPGIRTKVGEYLAPLFTRISNYPWPPPDPPATIWGEFSNDPGDFEISTLGAVPVLYVDPTAPFFWEEGSAFGVCSPGVASEIKVVFPSQPAPGDHISYPSNSNKIFLTDGTILVGARITVF